MVRIQCTEEEAETLGGKFLGISYGPYIGKILAHMVPTISPKEKRNGKVQYDACGLMSSVVLTGKIVMQTITAQEMD